MPITVGPKSSQKNTEIKTRPQCARACEEYLW